MQTISLLHSPLHQVSVYCKPYFSFAYANHHLCRKFLIIIYRFFGYDHKRKFCKCYFILTSEQEINRFPVAKPFFFTKFIFHKSGKIYFPSIYISIAFFIDGIFGIGASTSILKPFFITASTVDLPQTAILVLFCLKSGKL